MDEDQIAAALTHDATTLAPTISAGGQRKWIYPDRRDGPRARLRRRTALVLMGIYLLAPWVSVHGRPLVRIELLEGKIFFCGMLLRFADGGYLAFVLLGLALTLFFVTALRGRIWCGYACPQTVFVEWLIRPIEEFLEGGAHHRRQADLQPLTLARAGRKVVKHALFILVAAVIANVFLAYFIDPAAIMGWLGASPLAHPGPFLAMFTVLALFYFDLAWFREQFCSFLCPYARFQSVMIERETPVVAYDAKRGDPRGKRATGACIDCGLCQRVCPTGIDIRAGLQLECINCNRCEDACNMVMASLHRPLGLIRSASIAELDGQKFRSAWQRPRVLLYGAGMLLAFGLLTVRMAWFRSGVELTFSRQPGAVFSRLPDGRIANLFNMRSVNNSDQAQSLQLKAEEAGVEIICGSCQNDLRPFEARTHSLVIVLPIGAGGISAVRLHAGSGAETYRIPIVQPQ